MKQCIVGIVALLGITACQQQKVVTEIVPDAIRISDADFLQITSSQLHRIQRSPLKFTVTGVLMQHSAVEEISSASEFRQALPALMQKVLKMYRAREVR